MTPETFTAKVRFVEERASWLLKRASAPDNATELAEVYQEITGALAEIEAAGTACLRRDAAHAETHVEVALQREQEFLQTLLVNLTEGIVACDANGMLTLFNDTARRFHNLPQEPIPADQWANHYDLFLPDGTTPMRQEDVPLFRALQGEDVHHVEMMIVPRQGEPRTVLASGNALFDAEGQKIGAVVAMHDITERKRVEEALRAAKEELETRVAERTADLRTANRRLQIELNERKQAEQALRESEMRFRSLVEQSPLSTQIMTPDGKTVQVNRAWEQLWGVTLDRIPEYNMLEDQQLVTRGIMPYIQQGFAGEATEIPAIIYDPDQSIPDRSSHPDPRRWVRAFIYPVKDQAGTIQQVVLVHEDITEQVQDKARLQESETRFRQLAEHITEVFWMFDASTFEMLYISPAYEQIWGRTREDLVAQPRSFVEAIHPADQQYVEASLEQQLRGQQTLVEYRVEQPDGTVRWIRDRGFPIKDASGRVYRVAGLAEDITEQKQADEALRESEERYRRLVELSPETIGVHSEGKIVYINRTGVKLFGATSADELIGKPMLDRVHPAFREAIISRARMTHEHAQSVDLLEEKFLRLDGTVIDVEVAAIPITYQGKPAAQVVVRDITERKRAEAERTRLLLREQEARAEAEAAIVVRDEFLSIAAHELRTPVTALLAYTQVLERRAQHDQSIGERNRRTFRVLVEQAERLARLIGSLLDISRIQTGLFSLERAPLDLGTLCRRVATDVQVTTERHLIELIYPEEPILVEGDDLRLEQVLQNLLQNAIKYSPAGGPITVQLQRDDVSAVLSVSDRGIGIPQEAYGRLFQPYYRASNIAGSVIGGMGLGLYVVKELVERHNGSIEVVSAEGQGSTFIVRLPLV